MDARRVRILTLLLIAALTGFAFLIPLTTYPEKSGPLLSNWPANVEPTWTQLSGTFLVSQVHVGILNPSGPNGLRFLVLEAIPMNSLTDLNGTVTISGVARSSTMSSYNFYVFNMTTFTSWQSHETPAPYFLATKTSSVSFRFPLARGEATSKILFVIEAISADVDVTIQATADYIVKGGVHRVLLTNVGPPIPASSRDLVLMGDIKTLDASNNTLFSFYYLDPETFEKVANGQLQLSSVPALFRAVNVTMGFSFIVPLTEDPRGFDFVIDSPAFVGPPVHALLSAKLEYREIVQKTTADYVLDAAANSLLSSNPVSQAIGSFAGSVYPYVYLLGSIVLFVLFLGVVQLFVLVGLGSVSESRVLRRLDAFRDRFDQWKRQLSRLGKSEKSS